MRQGQIFALARRPSPYLGNGLAELFADCQGYEDGQDERPLPIMAREKPRQAQSLTGLLGGLAALFRATPGRKQSPA